MKTNTLTNERRRDERVTPPQQPRQKLYLCVDDQFYDVQLVWDVSPFGVGLQIDRALVKDTVIRLMYEYDSLDLQAQGTVIWSHALEDPADCHDMPQAHRIGIALGPEDLEENLRFFQVMTGR